MKNNQLFSGSSQRIITPSIGIPMAGWATRASGDNLAHFIHDDIYVKALCLESGTSSWALVVADVGAIDALITEEIRKKVSEKTSLQAESIMLCATHCHSAPILSPLALACSEMSYKSNTVDAKNTKIKDKWQLESAIPGVIYKNCVNQQWRTYFINQAVDSVIEAWNKREAVRIAYSEADVSGVASSRRVFMKDGTWADPRKSHFEEGEVADRTEVDPVIRNIFLRNSVTNKLLTVLTNYGSHPWIFPISGISAELAGATAKSVSSHFADNPIVIYTTGPEGDVSTIWNLDIKNLWQEHLGESKEESLKRREHIFDLELKRLSDLMLKAVIESYNKINTWTSDSTVSAKRKEVNLPLKSGYYHLPEVVQAKWQQNALPGHHLSEIQILQVGKMAIMGLPGEPFTSIGRQIKEKSPFKELIITALSNDSSAMTYIPDKKAYQRGGYEVSISTFNENAGEVLIKASVF